MPAIRSPIRSPFKAVLRAPLDYAGVAAAFSPATEYAAGTTGAWFTAYDNTYLKVNTNGTGGNVANGGVIGRWDDRSGNANHLPLWTGIKGPLFNSAAQGADFYTRDNATANNALVVKRPLATTLDRANMTGGVVYWGSGTHGSPVFDLYDSGGSKFTVVNGRRGNGPDLGWQAGGAITAIGLRAASRRAVITWRSNGTNLKIWVDGVLYTTTALSSVTMDGIAIGGTNNASIRACRVQELAVFNTAFSDAKMDAFNAYMAAQAGVAARDDTRTVDVITDSLGVGFFNESGIPWPNLTSIITDRPNSYWRTNGFDGAYAFTGVPISSAALIAAKGSAEAVCVWTLGTNDVLFGRTAAQMYTTLTDYSVPCRAAGIKFVVATLTDFVTNRAVKDAYNALVVAGSANFDGVARLDLRAELSDCTNTTYFHSDQVHYLDAGKAIVAAEVQAVLASV